MNNTAEKIALTAEDFLVWEIQQTEKYEFVAGEVFAMTGARRVYVVFCLNIAASLKQQLRGTSCQTYIADMKLHVAAADAFFYPDVMVSCHAEDQQAEHYLAHPTVIIEVLSDSTEAYDRGAKFAAYRLLSNLQEYVLIDIDARRVELFSRTSANDWLLHVSDADCVLNSLGITIHSSELFEGI